MGIKRRQYTKEQKEEMVQALVSGQTALQLGRENNISPSLINRWKSQYLNGELNENNNDQEINKVKKEIAKLEQMIGKLTMEKYILKKEKEYIIQKKREDSSIITGLIYNHSVRILTNGYQKINILLSGQKQ